MARYFQHLEKGGSKFLSVTELEYIDDSEPDFILYFFKDGTKCNQNMIGKINDMNAFGKMALVELSSPSNKWNIKIKEPANEHATRRAQDGKVYEIANPYGDIAKPQYEVISKPYFIKGGVEDDDTQNFKQSTTNFNNLVESSDIQQTILMQTVSQHSEDVSDEVFPLDTDYLISKNKTIEFKYNGKKYSMPALDFFANAIKYPEEKIIEKEVVKEVRKEVSDEHINIDITDEQKVLVDNMINMSQKETCDIDMELTLTLPPISVYQLIKQVYPAGMAKGFVNIIADRMQIKELKMAVANGLLAYYDEDAIIEEVIDNKQKVIEAEPCSIEQVQNEYAKDINFEKNLYKNNYSEVEVENISSDDEFVESLLDVSDAIQEQKLVKQKAQHSKKSNK